MQQVQLQVDDEMKAAGDALGLLIADIKAGKTVAQIAADVLPGLVSAVGGYASMATDIKKPDNQLYLLRGILAAVEPAPAS